MTEKSNQRKYSKVAKQRAKGKIKHKKRVKGKPSKPANQNSLFSALSYTASRAIKILIIFVLLIGFLLAGFGSGMVGRLYFYCQTTWDCRYAKFQGKYNFNWIEELNLDKAPKFLLWKVFFLIRLPRSIPEFSFEQKYHLVPKSFLLFVE